MESVSRRGLFQFLAGIGAGAVVGVNPTPATAAAAAPSVSKAFSWARVELLHRGLRGELGQGIHDSWFQSLNVENFDGEILTVSVPAVFLKKWISTHYADALLRAAQRADPTVEQVRIGVRRASSATKSV